MASAQRAAEGFAGASAAATRAVFKNLASSNPVLYQRAVQGDPAAIRALSQMAGDVPRIGSNTPTARLGTSAAETVGNPYSGTRGYDPERGLIVRERELMAPGPGGLDDLNGVPMGRAAGDMDELFDASPRKRGRVAAAGALAAGGGALALNSMRPVATTADLKAEAKPPPSVPTMEAAPKSAREQAYALMKDLNARRRAAGGEVPDGPQVDAEVKRLLSMASKEDNSQVRSNSVPAPASNTDYRRMAQQKMAELNAFQATHGANHPQSRQLKAEMSRLYAMADDQTNARTTAFPGRR